LRKRRLPSQAPPGEEETRMGEEQGRGLALVTGASRGIGAATVQALAAAGFRVIAGARDRAALDRLAAETPGTRIEPLTLDVTADADLAGLDTLPIDLAVLNAGIMTSARAFHLQDMAEVDRQIAVNLRGAMAVTHRVLPGMIARGRGHLVFVTSLIALHPFPNVAIYAATKAGLHGFAQALRMDLAGTGIRVSEIAPGRVRTDTWREATGGNPAAIERIFGPYRALLPEEVAETILAVVDLPPHADASLVELSPTDQAVGGSVFAERRDRSPPGAA
jgi:3-hydroxy acid dehydrogenase / malonic semialdehyde reductase